MASADTETQRGVTLIELLVAMIILAIALVGLAASFPAAMYGVSIGGFQTTATLAADQCIEMARDMARSGVATVTTAALTAGGSVAAQACGSDTGFGPGFVRTVTVQDGATFGGYPATVRIVTVTVTFTNTPDDPTPVISTTLRTILGG
jgi:prepilin-type N-terminal cleavage/methylation domain-containing protein